MSEINSKQIQSSSNQQRILITEVSGLIGRILFHYLTKTYSNEYQVFGIDLHMNISSRYQPKNDQNLPVEPDIMPLPTEIFFQCDINDRDQFYQILQQQQMEILIHLAAALHSHSNIEKILLVNIEGTKNGFHIGEQMDKDILKNSSISIISVRFGWVSIYDQPGTPWNRTI